MQARSLWAYIRDRRFVDFASAAQQPDELDALEKACDAAVFGKDRETVLDETYRRAGKAVQRPAHWIARRRPPGSSHWCPGEEDRRDGACSPKHLFVGKGAFIKPHLDTPRSADMFGSLVVVILTPHEGGELILRQGGKEWTFDSARLFAGHNDRVAFVAFFSDIEQEQRKQQNEGMADVGDGRTLKMKKSSTFRARATQAFRSIKNVGKSNNTSNRRASVSAPKLMMPTAPPKSAKMEDGSAQTSATLPSRHSCQEPSSPRPTSPTVNRRRSLTLSQMFAFKEKEKENQGSGRPASPMSAEPPSPAHPSHDSEPFARPMSPTEFRSSSSHGDFLQPMEDCEATPTRSTSPTGDDPSKPTLSKRKSFRRRLSVLELQKLFSKGGSSNSQPATVRPFRPSSVADAHHSDIHHSQVPSQDTEEDLFSPTSRSRPLSMDSTDDDD
ncbi:hypothetical protein NUW54_g9720 [Trametes sanguinea]|uniref:Uncharacterized protein n=1 Tax=Trametes sanguinea TaxID=158606 RepID=A0ACC1P5M1_9APHY|nr:hypothetical protein NUW54_g9720 [Trametes sanguinea]